MSDRTRTADDRSTAMRPVKVKVYGQLVLLGFAIADFTPGAYQRSHLLRPLEEVSS